MKNARRWDGRSSSSQQHHGRGRASRGRGAPPSRRHRSLSAGRNTRKSNRAAARYLDDDNLSLASYFSDDSNKSSTSAATTEDDRRARKRKCLVWMMAIYMFVASITFFSLMMWRFGVFDGEHGKEAASALQEKGMLDGTSAGAERLCNGLASNCQRRINEVMFATIHNAMSSRENNFLVPNNYFPFEDALVAGYRAISLDSCDCKRVGIQLCHGLCVTGFRKPIPAFEAIVSFLQQYPHEVIIVELQVGDDSLFPLFNLLQEVDGLSSLMYHHDWILDPLPTFDELIDLNQVCVFAVHLSLHSSFFFFTTLAYVSLTPISFALLLSRSRD